jgi:hypothetical protein
VELCGAAWGLPNRFQFPAVDGVERCDGADLVCPEFPCPAGSPNLRHPALACEAPDCPDTLPPLTPDLTAACCCANGVRCAAAPAEGMRLKKRWPPISARGTDVATARFEKRRLLAVGAMGNAPRASEACCS